ncbi:MAG: hypothetical protein VX294_03505 [Candidatus Latescibacterota bacterium]|nr:hypothetical protein [Candidatus Latescibacterota bacterium]
MIHSEEKKYFLDNQRNVKKLIGVFFTLCALLIAIDLFFHRHLSFSDDAFLFESYFGFYAVYGFVACVILVVVAKELRKVLMRKEDYYDV